MKEKTECFIEEYKKLEQYAKMKYGFPDDGKAITHLGNLPGFRSIQAKLFYCRDIRNTLQHNPRIKDSFAVEPSDEMIAFLKDIITRVSRKAIEFAVPKIKVLAKTMKDTVRPTMIQMLQNTYTHVPILDNGVVVGVFSENTLLSYLGEEQIVGIEEKTCFSDLEKYLPINCHTSESFRFVPQDALLSDVSVLFDEALANQDRIGLVFITQNGLETEKMLGIITAWDIAGRL